MILPVAGGDILVTKSEPKGLGEGIDYGDCTTGNGATDGCSGF
jgi:hypothetical protein